MQQAKPESPRIPAADASVSAGKKAPTRDRHTKRVVLGLTGLLGAAWAVVIASRYAGFVAG